MVQLVDGTLLGRVGFDTNAGIGAGGYMTRLEVADDGTVVSGSDSSGPYIRKPGDRAWTELFRAGISADDALVDAAHAWQACYEVAICPENSDVVYFLGMVGLHKTMDGGKTVTRCAGLPLIDYFAPNEGNIRTQGKIIAIDPKNPNVVIVGLQGGADAGIRYSEDGGETFTLISTATLPPGRDEGGGVTKYCIAFDRTSPVVGGKTQGVYVFCNSEVNGGLYHSTTGVGGPYVIVTPSSGIAGPTTACKMKVSPHDGTVHTAGDGINAGIQAQYYRYNPSTNTWTAPDGIIGTNVAISPHHAGHVYLTNDGTQMNCSTDNGDTWANWANPLRKSNDIPWHEWADQGYMAHGDLYFDGTLNRMWLGDGIGTWYVDNPPTSGYIELTWQEASAGIENMISGLMQCDDDGNLMYSCHDRRHFVVPRTDFGARYPATYVWRPNGAIVHGGGMDFAPDDPDVMVATLNGLPGVISHDRGRSWAPFPGDVRDFSGGVGGGPIVALSSTVFIQRETNNGRVMWSKDGGETWANLFAAINPNGLGSHVAYWVSHRPLVRDRYVANQAYVYFVGEGNSGTPEDLAYRGIWRINYNPGTEAMTLTRVHGPGTTGGPQNDYAIINYGADFWHGKFTQIGEDDWLWCAGDGGIGLWRSTDGMATWAEFGIGTDDVNTGGTSFGDVFSVGVGPGRLPGHKTLLVNSWRNTVSQHSSGYDKWGWWLSEGDPATTLGETWKRVEKWLGGQIYASSDLCGDPGVYGTFYAGILGAARIRYQDKREITGASSTTLAALTGTFSLPENAAAGDNAGNLVGKVIGSTLSLVDDAGGRIALLGASVIRGATGLDYATADHHSFTVRETLAGYSNSPRDTVLNLAVTNVFEQPALAALAFSGTMEQGASSSVTIDNKTVGSTLSLQSGALPAGMTLGSSSITGTPSTSGSGSATIRETLEDSPNSPRDNVYDWSVAAPGGASPTDWTETTGTSKSQYVTVSGTPPLITTVNPGVGTALFVRAKRAAFPNKFQWEATLTVYSSEFIYIGVDDGTTNLQPWGFPGLGAATGVVWLITNVGGVSVWYDGSQHDLGGIISAPLTGDVYSVVVDKTARIFKLYRTRSGTTTLVNSVTPTTALSDFFAVIADKNSSTWTANFGQSAFSRALDAGYAAY